MAESIMSIKNKKNQLTVFVTNGIKSKASFSFPSNSTTTTKRFVHVKTALLMKRKKN